MIAIQAIAFATIRRFLSLRPERSCCCSMRPSACSAIIVASLESVSETSESLAAVVSTFLSFATIGELVIRQCQHWRQQTMRRHLGFSEQVVQNGGERTLIAPV